MRNRLNNKPLISLPGLGMNKRIFEFFNYRQK